MVLLNDGRAPTFIPGFSKSHIDVIFYTSECARRIKDWAVKEEEESNSYEGIVVTSNESKWKDIRNY